MNEVVSKTESVCPECLKRISAENVIMEGDVYLIKTCPEHGRFSTIVWRGTPAYSNWLRPKTPSFPAKPLTPIKDGCPYDCGLCPDHRQHTCSVLIEITQRCDLGCPVCFADSGNASSVDWTHDEVRILLERLLDLGGPFNLQFSGGEPCVRDDLPELITLARKLGFSYIQVNSNGLRIAQDGHYLQELKKSGLSTVFLQFDGTKDAIYRQIRGRDLMDVKMAAIEQCKKAGVGVVLVPTIIPGINTANIGEMVDLAITHMPAVRGIHFQPVSYFGRYPSFPENEQRYTLPELMRDIETQTDERMKVENFTPPGCENAFCSFHGNFVLMPDGRLLATSKHNPADACTCQPIIAADGAAQSRAFVAQHWSPNNGEGFEIESNQEPSFGEWDIFMARKRTHTFCVSAMAFQDAWTLDLNRLRDCCIHIATLDGGLVPFCAYNLTNRNGRSLYRSADAMHTP